MGNIFCAIENSPIHQRLLKYKDLTNESIHQLYQLKSICGIDFREAPFACVNTTLRNAVACMVLIAPEGACHAFGMPARVMMTSFPGPDQKQIIMFLKHYVSQT